MAEFQTLSRPPINEAVFRIAFEPSQPELMAPKALKDRFPEGGDWRRKSQYEGELSIDTSTHEVAPSVEHSIRAIGWFLPSQEEPESVTEFEKNALTYHRLSPYTSFEECKCMILSTWENYKALVSPKLVTKLSMRYFNSFVLPKPPFDFTEYFTFPLPIAPSLDPLISANGGFRTELNLLFSGNVSGRLGFRMATDADQPEITFDIRVTAHASKDEPFEENIGVQFDRLRDIKNRIFFDSLTDKATALFNS